VETTVVNDLADLVDRLTKSEVLAQIIDETILLTTLDGCIDDDWAIVALGEDGKSHV
jgi:hypothetical protein